MYSHMGLHSTAIDWVRVQDRSLVLLSLVWSIHQVKPVLQSPESSGNQTCWYRRFTSSLKNPYIIVALLTTSCLQLKRSYKWTFAASTRLVGGRPLTTSIVRLSTTSASSTGLQCCLSRHYQRIAKLTLTLRTSRFLQSKSQVPLWNDNYRKVPILQLESTFHIALCSLTRRKSKQIYFQSRSLSSSWPRVSLLPRPRLLILRGKLCCSHVFFQILLCNILIAV